MCQNAGIARLLGLYLLDASREEIEGKKENRMLKEPSKRPVHA